MLLYNLTIKISPSFEIPNYSITNLFPNTLKHFKTNKTSSSLFKSNTQNCPTQLDMYTFQTKVSGHSQKSGNIK